MYLKCIQIIVGHFSDFLIKHKYNCLNHMVDSRVTDTEYNKVDRVDNRVDMVHSRVDNKVDRRCN